MASLDPVAVDTAFYYYLAVAEKSVYEVCTVAGSWVSKAVVEGGDDVDVDVAGAGAVGVDAAAVAAGDGVAAGGGAEAAAVAEAVMEGARDPSRLTNRNKDSFVLQYQVIKVPEKQHPNRFAVLTHQPRGGRGPIEKKL